jgi:hypothetical protein
MRQRLVVFVIVTLLAAVCIAALQGCHRLTGGQGAPGGRVVPMPATGAGPHSGSGSDADSGPGSGSGSGSGSSPDSG